MPVLITFHDLVPLQGDVGRSVPYSLPNIISLQKFLQEPPIYHYDSAMGLVFVEFEDADESELRKMLEIITKHRNIEQLVFQLPRFRKESRYIIDAQSWDSLIKATQPLLHLQRLGFVGVDCSQLTPQSWINLSQRLERLNFKKLVLSHCNMFEWDEENFTACKQMCEKLSTLGITIHVIEEAPTVCYSYKSLEEITAAREERKKLLAIKSSAVSATPQPMPPGPIIFSPMTTVLPQPSSSTNLPLNTPSPDVELSPLTDEDPETGNTKLGNTKHSAGKGNKPN